MATVTIITPTYNHSKFIEQCIESVQAQTFQDWEMILIDDGSEDNTLHIANEYSKCDSRINIVSQSNIGSKLLYETYNRAFRRSSGKLIAILEGDDFWPDNKLEIQVKIHKNSSIIMIYGKFLLHGEHVQAPGPQPRFTGDIDTHSFFGEVVLGRSHMLAVTQMIRRDALEQIGGFHQDGSPGAVDMATLLRLAQLRGAVHFCPEVLGYWRQHPYQATQTRGVALAEHNRALAVAAYDHARPEIKHHLGFGVADIHRSRAPLLADVYFSATRTALIQRNRKSVNFNAARLWKYGGPLRKFQAVYALMAAPMGQTYEPLLRWHSQIKALRQRQHAPAPD